MQRRCGRRHRAGPARENRLIVDPITPVRRPFGGDIGRQGHLADSRQGRVEICARAIKAQMRLPVGHAFQRRAQIIGKGNDLTRSQFLQRFDQCRPGAIGARLQQGHFHPGRRFASGPDAATRPGKPRRNHPRVIQHQPVTGAQEPRQITHRCIGEDARLRNQQARGAARAGGPRGDQLLGQVKIKVIQLHGPRAISALPRLGYYLLPPNSRGVALGCSASRAASSGLWGRGPRKMSRNTLGVSAESGFTFTDGLAEVPRRV